MTENIPPATSAAPNDLPGQPFYEKTRTHLKELLHKQRILMRNLQAQEDSIYKKETEYLEDTPAGNIIVGFEGYTKGTGAGAGGGQGRKKSGVVREENRVFSRSSVSWGMGSSSESPFDTAQSTPVTAVAPTPLSASFTRGEAGGSNHATPTTATASGNKGVSAGASIANGGGAGRKNKKNAGEESDGERDRERDAKKARTNFGVGARK